MNSPKITIGFVTTKENNTSEKFLCRGTARLKCGKNINLIIADQDDMWITHKKNWIVQQSDADYLCLIHDYYDLAFNEFRILDPSADIIATPIINYNDRGNYRGPDWILNPNHISRAIDIYPELRNILIEAAPEENDPKYVANLPYEVSDLANLQYISGGYIFCKRQLLLDHPLDESLKPGQSEDVEWSERIMKAGAKLVFDDIGANYILRANKWKPTTMPLAGIQIMRKYNERYKAGDI